MTHGHIMPPHLWLTRSEAEQLMAYMRPQYLNPNEWPHIVAFLKRMEHAAEPMTDVNGTVLQD